MWTVKGERVRSVRSRTWFHVSLVSILILRIEEKMLARASYNRTKEGLG